MMSSEKNSEIELIKMMSSAGPHSKAILYELIKNIDHTGHERK